MLFGIISYTFSVEFNSLKNVIKRGDTIILYSTTEINNIHFDLKKNGKIIESGIGFVRENEKKERNSYVFIGISAYFSAGEYEVTLTLKQDGKRDMQKLNIPIKIEDREFPVEMVDFDSENTDLFKNSSPEKIEQTKKLVRIVTTLDKEAIFGSQRFFQPLDYVFYNTEYGSKRISKYSDHTQSVSRHNAIDYKGSLKTPIHSPSAGKVVFAGARITTGLTVILEHFPGVYSLFYHMSKINVEEGEMVTRTQKLGEIGSTGFSTGPHLHWEMRVNNVQVDPIFFVRNDFFKN